MGNSRKNSLLFLLLGIISLSAQTIFLRELMMAVNGNEIIFAITLSLWLFLIAIGSLIGNKIPAKNSIITLLMMSLNFLILLQFLLIPYLINLINPLNGEMVSIPILFFTTFATLTPVALLLGILFPLLCKTTIISANPIQYGYIWESIGIILGGIILALLLNFFSHFQILILLTIFNLIVFYLWKRRLFYLILILPFFVVLFFSNKIFWEIYAEKYEGQKLLSSQNSVYGRLDITSCHDQKNYFWNGELTANSENEFYAQQMTNFMMLQHPAPKKILMIGGVLNGSLREIQKYDPEEVICLELADQILDQLPNSPQVKKVAEDPLRYLRSTKEKFDMVICDLPDPSSLQLNRFYTKEFFALIKQKFNNEQSVFVSTLSSGTNFMTKEIINLNASIFKTLKKVFSNVQLIPSQKNIFLASKGNYLSNDPEVLIQRGKAFFDIWFNPVVINEKCNELRLENIRSKIEEENIVANSFALPVVYLNTLQLWSSKLDPKFDIFRVSHWKLIATTFILSGLLIFFLQMLLPTNNIPGDLGIFSISLINFSLQLILVNYFQIYFGYAYFMIIFFTSGFMTGLVLGFYLSKKMKLSLKLLFLINLILILFLFFVPKLPAFFYFLLNILFAVLEGMILARLLAEKFRSEKLAAAGSFYCLDSFGAALGGIIFGVILLPVLGFQFSLLILSMILLINIIIVMNSS